MRIAYVLGGFPGISETFIAHQIAGIAALGHEVDLFATSDSTAPSAPEVVTRYGLLERLHRIDPPRNRLVRLAGVILMILRDGWRAPGVLLRSLNVARYGKSAASLELAHAALTLVHLDKRRYDVVHAQFGTFGMLALRLVETGALEGAVVVSFRGYDATQYLRAHPHAYDQLFARGRLFLPVSRVIEKHLEAAGCDPAKLHVHHSGIDCERFAYHERTRAAGEPTRIVTVGRLVEKKGVAFGLEAIARVLAAGRAVSYTIVGEGALQSELERLIDRLGIGAHVRMLGRLSHAEVASLLNDAHILLTPSVTAADGDQEGIPNVLKEAMAMGLPVVGTEHAGIPELVENGVSGYLVPERDVAGLADRLIQLVDRPETWITLGRMGRMRVLAEFDIRTQSQILAALYREASEAGGSITNAAPSVPRRAASTT
jgi:colanic acid/amylovoran/stewartan biosynthesis glycosyltransferase WcaL/AmsK/CpsK